MIKVVIVRPENIAADWPLCTKYIEAACRRGGEGMTLAEADAALTEPACRLFLILREYTVIGAGILENCGEELFVIAIGYDAMTDDETADVDAQLVRIAKDQGCARIAAVGRKGWPRHIARLGYRKGEGRAVIKEV